MIQLLTVSHAGTPHPMACEALLATRPDTVRHIALMQAPGEAGLIWEFQLVEAILAHPGSIVAGQGRAAVLIAQVLAERPGLPVAAVILADPADWAPGVAILPLAATLRAQVVLWQDSDAPSADLRRNLAARLGCGFADLRAAAALPMDRPDTTGFPGWPAQLLRAIFGPMMRPRQVRAMPV